MTEKLIAVNAIRTDGETQAREAIDLATVAEYAEALARGEKFPPVDVYHDGKDFWLARGFHRWHAHRKAERAEILCTISRGTVEEARWHAYGDNVGHGLRRTRADIERAVKLALAHPKALTRSNAELARYLGVAENTIRGWRDRLSAPNPRANSEARQKPHNADSSPNSIQHKGPVFQHGPKNAPSTADLDNIPMDPPPVVERGASPGKSSQPAAKREPVDETGKVLPEKVRTDFNRSDEIQDLMTQVSRIKAYGLERKKEKDPLFADLNPSAFQAECENLYRALRALKPYAVCPYCNGKGCKVCLSRGWLGVFIYEAAPKELKKGRK